MTNSKKKRNSLPKRCSESRRNRPGNCRRRKIRRRMKDKKIVVVPAAVIQAPLLAH